MKADRQPLGPFPCRWWCMGPASCRCFGAGEVLDPVLRKEVCRISLPVNEYGSNFHEGVDFQARLAAEAELAGSLLRRAGAEVEEDPPSEKDSSPDLGMVTTAAWESITDNQSAFSVPSAPESDATTDASLWRSLGKAFCLALTP